jgi:hypothetical protein
MWMAVVVQRGLDSGEVEVMILNANCANTANSPKVFAKFAAFAFESPSLGMTPRV